MSSWKIIKTWVVNGRPGTVGHITDTLKACDLFLSLENKLKDWPDASKDFDEDSDVTNALLNRRGILDMKEAGIL